MSFISDYIAYVSGNEVPQVYHEWASLSVIASMMGRRVWVDQGDFFIYPNLYVIFVGDPANGKSTAMDLAESIAEELKIPICPDSVTKEKLTQLLGGKSSPFRRDFKIDNVVYENTCITIFADEILTLLGTAPLEMVKVLTALYQKKGDYKVATKNKGDDLIKRPSVNILGCMTPEVTTSLIKQSIISGGFSRRCIFVYRDRNDLCVPRPKKTPEQFAAKERCLARGRKISTLKGQFQWHPEAYEFFDDWYGRNKAMTLQHRDMATIGYYRAKDGMLLRVSMLITLSESDDLILTRPVLERALDLLNDTEKSLHRVFEGAGRNVQSSMAARAITMAERAKDKTVTEKEFFLYLFEDGPRDEIAQVLHQLVSTDRLRKIVSKGITKYQLIE